MEILELIVHAWDQVIFNVIHSVVKVNKVQNDIEHVYFVPMTFNIIEETNRIICAEFEAKENHLNKYAAYI